MLQLKILITDKLKFYLLYENMNIFQMEQYNKEDPINW